MTDRAQDVLVSPAMGGEILVSVGVKVFGVGAEVGTRAKVGIGSRIDSKLARPQRAHGQPPAMAGSNRSSSVAPSGVASPSR